ncbi:glycosyltransferase [Paramicrobacterium agarici]|uniref:Glycosyl transferase family 1 n=1 Tax=Paramicrobacterium agarici TaxID=630514 RepID=A0A2A9DWC1_9MICO|nr:glycosyltransferase [Microbacterium agarici]PFG30435.1 glycosyl transferase family 1 [Microbacterium agarici]
MSAETRIIRTARSEPHTEPASADSSLTILLFSLEPWDTVWRRNQYLVDGLVRADDSIRVFFVEPPSDIAHDVLSGRRPRFGSGTRIADGYDGRLTLIQPTKWLPRVLGPGADRMLQSSVRRALRRVGSTPSVLWFNDPRWASMLTVYSAPALYDMTDDWLAARRTDREHDRLVRDEDALMQTCGAIVVCSVGLATSRRSSRPDLVTIPNAVDVERYRQPASRPTDLPDGACAVYAGTLHEDRIDVDLVVRTGAALSAIGGTCVLVGPNALTPENTQRLVLSPGVLMLGIRPYEAIPGYLQHAEVLIVPHAVTPFTESLDPIKLYEYQAVDRPVVSTPVAGFRENEQPGTLDIASAADFPARVVEALQRPTVAHHREHVPDWRCRVKQFAAVLRELVDQRRRSSHISPSLPHPVATRHPRSDGRP